jgi:hypothetical protein
MVAVDHHLPSGHSRRDPAQQISPVGQSRIGNGADDHPFVFRRNRKEAGDQLLGLGGVRSDRPGDEAEIDAGILRLLETLRVKQHAHGGGDVSVVGLGAVIIDPLLHDAERSARIDLRRDGCMRGLYQQEQPGDECCVAHVMLLTVVRACEGRGANVSGSRASRHLKRL